MARDVDILTSFTLKHLRDRWWDASFTAFLGDALLPSPVSASSTSAAGLARRS